MSNQFKTFQKFSMEPYNLHWLKKSHHKKTLKTDAYQNRNHQKFWAKPDQTTPMAYNPQGRVDFGQSLTS